MRNEQTAPESALPQRAFLVLFVLWLMVFASGSQVMLISPVFPRIREQLGLPAEALGALIGVDAVMLGVVALIAGPISDRVGRRRILLAGTGLMSFALGAHALATDFVSLLIVRGLAGAAGGVLSGSAVAYVGDYFPYRRRGWANGWVMTGMAFGQIVGIPLGTMLAANFGFRSSYLVFAASMAATFVLVWSAVPQPSVHHESEPLSFGHAARSYISMLQQPAIAAAVTTFAVTFLGNALFFIYLPTWMEDHLSATPMQVAGLFFFGGIANVIAGPRAGHLSDRIGRKIVIISSSAGLAALVLATGLIVRHVWVAYALFFGVMILLSARVGPFQALLTQLVPAHKRGALMSLAVGLGQVGFATGGLLAGYTYRHYGYVGDTILSSILLLLSAWLVWRFLPEPHAEDLQPEIAPAPEALAP
jgi:predicted MFS family arabinose efflux permease